MAASRRRMNGPWVGLALGALACLLIFHSGPVSADVTDAVDGVISTIITIPPELEDILARGDDDPTAVLTDHAAASEPQDDQTPPPDVARDPDAVDPTPKGDASEDSMTSDPQFSIDLQTIFGLEEAATVVVPGVVVKGPEDHQPKDGVQCVDKEELKDKDVIKLELKATSSCEETKAKFKELLGDLCGQDCDLKIFQEESSSQIIVSGEDIEADAQGMAGKFSSQGIKEKLGVVEASPRWGKHPPTVLVALLITGLLLAAALIGGYCLKNHRAQPAKSARLAEESFPVDQENQGNTLVSVAPLHPQEPQDKPSANGESPEGVKTEAPPTNGHSTTKSPVADTEL